jgi:DNA polymerase delta subunit 3
VYSELATYHHDAPYKSQTCAATYLLSGTVLREDQPLSTQQDQEDDDGDDVPQVQVTIVNEADLEGSFKDLLE